jgi:hypothetical protein
LRLIANHLPRQGVVVEFGSRVVAIQVTKVLNSRRWHTPSNQGDHDAG